MSKKTKKTLSSVMDARRKSIQSKSRMLVECILAKDPLTANKIFPKLVAESQYLRELEVKKLIKEDDDDWSTDDTDTDESEDDTTDDSSDDWSTDDTDTDEGGDDTTDDTTDDSSDEETSDEADLDSTDQDTDKVINDTIEIQCQINAKVIENLFNVIADLKNSLNNQDLDETSKEFITLDTTIAYYSDKLQELQNQTNPGTDQSKLEEKLDTITKALDELKEKVGGGSSEDEDISPDMSATEENTDESTEESAEDEETSEEGSEEGTEETAEDESEEGTEETSEDEEDTLGQA